MVRFICISGKAQHGKDTCGNIIEEELKSLGYKTLIIHYADLLKWICKTYFSWNGEKDTLGRSILQKIGTEIVRSKKPDYWVDFVISFADLFGENFDYIIIPDCRFPNEIDKLKDSRYETKLIRVIRTNYNNGLSEEQKHHASETALDDYPYDILLQNDTDINNLKVKIKDDLIQKLI